MELKLNKLPKNGTQEFWYDISMGGYLKASDFSDDLETIEQIEAAVDILLKVQSYLEQNDLID